MGDICVEACIEIWQKQCVGQCEKEIDKCYNAAIETCKDAALTCALAAAACALLPATGPGVLGCALAAVPCLENFDDCLDGLDCDDDFDSCVESCIENKEKCCLHC